MGTVFSYLKPYRGAIALALVLVLVQSVAELLLPTLLALIIDQGVVKGDLSAVVSAGLWMLAAGVTSALAAVAASWVSSRMGAGFGRDLRSALFRKTTFLSEDQFGRLGAASLITRTTNDVVQVQSFVVMSLRLLASAPLMAVGGVMMSLVIDPGLALVLLTAVPVLATAITVVALRAVKYFRQLQSKVDALNRVLKESLSGVRVIRAFERQDVDAQRFDTANLDLAAVSLKTLKLTAVVMPGMQLAMGLSSLALIWFGGARVADGLAIGGLLAFVQYSTMILFSLMMLSILFVALPRAAVSAGRINEVLAGPAEPQEPAEEVSESGYVGVEFRNVSFRYPGADQPALENVSFRAAAGSFTAFIGGTGSGKSTILKLIARFYEATEGQVLVDGTDVRSWPKEQLRRRLGIAFQNPRLFAGSIADNVRWGAPEATDEEVAAALQKAQSKDFVDKLPGGAAAPVDQGGANFSGGQKQRLSIARALIRKPAALLLDDSFSALDYKTDSALRTEILGGTRPTVLLVAQRLATVREADHIVVIDDGRVMGAGTHGELLRSCQAYREIAASQELPEALS